MSEERLYTAEEVEALLLAASKEVNLVLKGLLRNLAEVRQQRGAAPLTLPEDRIAQLKRMGEIEGLNIAIAAVRRRIR